LSDFPHHLAQVSANLQLRRDELLGAVSGLKDVDLVRARRGGWTVGKVLEHITNSEWHYARLVANLRGRGEVAHENHAAAGVADASEALASSRAALLNAIDGVSEEDFYRLGPIGREEYSVVSVLENVEQHDIEHLGQIRAIQADSR
jgi:uncharacterized damage-inducible protein DinB